MFPVLRFGMEQLGIDGSCRRSAGAVWSLAPVEKHGTTGAIAVPPARETLAVWRGDTGTTRVYGVKHPKWSKFCVLVSASLGVGLRC